MSYKTCKRCEVEWEICNFPKSKCSDDGHENICKKCKKQYSHIRHLIKSGKITGVKKQERQEILVYLYQHFEKSIDYLSTIFKCEDQHVITYLKSIDIYNKKFCLSCKKWISLNFFYEASNKKNNKQSICINCWTNRNKINNIRRNEEDIDKVREKKQTYYDNNREKVRKYKTEWARNKYRTDPTYRLHSNMSTQLYLMISKEKNFRNWEEILGYTTLELKVHLEQQFQEGMTWENYGDWHVDHIIPKSSFVIDSIESIEFKQCWKLENLQPLWAEDNIRKSNKMV